MRLEPLDDPRGSLRARVERERRAHAAEALPELRLHATADLLFRWQSLFRARASPKNVARISRRARVAPGSTRGSARDGPDARQFITTSSFTDARASRRRTRSIAARGSPCTSSFAVERSRVPSVSAFESIGLGAPLLQRVELRRRGRAWSPGPEAVLRVRRERRRARDRDVHGGSRYTKSPAPRPLVTSEKSHDTTSASASACEAARRPAGSQMRGLLYLPNGTLKPPRLEAFTRLGR